MKMKKLIGKAVGTLVLCGTVVATLPMIAQATDNVLGVQHHQQQVLQLKQVNCLN